jgi:glycogen debranching enzyme
MAESALRKLEASPETSTVSPEQYQIAASFSLQERRPRTLKHGDAFAVLDPSGDILSGKGSSDGLYYRDTRHLSGLGLLVSQVRPILLSSTIRDDNAALTCDLTNPDLREADQLVLDHDLLHVRRTIFLWNATRFERLCIRNFSDSTLAFTIELWFEADFVDLFEVRGIPRQRRGRFHRPQVGQDRVTLSYTGLDDRRRITRLRFDPMPDHLDEAHAVYRCELAPGAQRILFLEIACTEGAPERQAREHYLASFVSVRRELRQFASRGTTIQTSNEIFNEAIRRALADLQMLITETGKGPYFYAGIPWFSTVFGRDALLTSYLNLWRDPIPARGVLAYLAANQADTVDSVSDAEPGKILHEVRHGEMSNLGEVPFRHYYGSIDSTPLFVLLAGAYVDRIGDVETVRMLWPNIERALAWIDQYGDIDGDGFVEYIRRTPTGLANQGWKDSYDSIFHADGRLAEPPIALCEVQAYVYGAKRAAAEIAAKLGMTERAAALKHEAVYLRGRFDEAFWCEDIGTYALALDGEKKPCRVRTSNAGQALFTGIALSDRVPRLARTLIDASAFSGWGVRTVATGEARYNPMSYHNGSVWPHDNALIALGLARYGFKREAARIFEGLFGASVYIDLRRLPELFCGFPRRSGQGPTYYPVACSPQAWAAASLVSLVQACLGLRCDSDSATVYLDRPVLPRFLDSITLRNLRAGSGVMDIGVRQAGGGEVAAHLIRRSGGARLVVTS